MAGHIAIFDVGKSNKKVVVFDQHMQQVATAYQAFPAHEHDEEHSEQTRAVGEWLLATLSDMASQFDIRAIGTTTHGACGVGVDDQGDLVEPVFAYTTDPGTDFHRSFHSRCGDARRLHRELATPAMGRLLNLGLGAAYVRERHPEQWARIRHFLPYPQYFAHLLCGGICAEPTMLGCHSYLYDFETGGYSRIAEEMRLSDKLPAIVPSGQVVGTVSKAVAAATGLSTDCRVIAGVHDSNASLVPYLMLSPGRFILNSTGTWCVLMRPSDHMHLDDEQLDLGIFYNCSVTGDPVKTAVLMGGQERLDWLQVFQTRHENWQQPQYDAAVYRAIITEARDFILPGSMPGTGPFPHSTSRLICGDTCTGMEQLRAGGDAPGLRDPAHDDALLTISLALQTAAMLEQLEPEDGMTVFIEGGFRHNIGYQKLLAALLPQLRFVLSNLQEATAFGTGLLTLAALRECPLSDLRDSVSVDTHAVDSEDFPGLADYRQRFERLARS